MIPRATYRLQFHRDFPFASGAELAPYLERLGISHVYSSPILTARPGSLHGYDTIDHGAINPELGGETGFAALSATLRRHGMGIVLDIVPNHMAVGGSGNGIWLDVLAFGKESRFAHWFDINFQPPAGELSEKLLLPFLGSSYGDVLKSGELTIVETDGPTDFAIRYFDHVFPIRPADCVAIRQHGLAAYESPEDLGRLLDSQHYRLAGWRSANDRLNWRRFFDVTELAALSIEHADVFEAVHRIPLRLYAEGLIDGLRVDHVDGLSDPPSYCRHLRARLDELAPQRPAGGDRAYLIVEKILAPGEELPASWQVDGTSGYEFMNMVSALQHDPAAAVPLGFLWRSLTDRTASFETEEDVARREILHRNFWGQLEDLAVRLKAHAETTRPGSDLTQPSFMRAIAEIVAALRVYRSYRGRADGEPWEPAFRKALATARRKVFQDAPAFDVIEQLTAPDAADHEQRHEILRRLHQLSAPVAAKAVEDTAFYRYGRLLSRNDVGFSPAQFSVTGDEFQAWIGARVRDCPNGMLATATHDHKRGEDARARLAVLSEIPDLWAGQVEEWWRLNGPLRPPGLAPDDEYLLYQTLVGCWPMQDGERRQFGALHERLRNWQLKAIREAKLRSHWLAQDESYEGIAGEFLAALLDPERSSAFLSSFSTFIDSIAPAGALNGLTQAALRCLVPGLPDLYQGAEFWDFSLVDPDNRRPVDFSARQEALLADDSLESLAAAWRDGRVKQRLIGALLALRREIPDLFRNGSCIPLAVKGPRRENFLAFRRDCGGDCLIVAVPLRMASAMMGTMMGTMVSTGTGRLMPGADWLGDTHIALAEDLALSNILSNNLRGEAPAALPAGRVLTFSEWMGPLPMVVARGKRPGSR